MTILLSGKISKSKNYIERFAYYENELRIAGFTVINPAKNKYPKNIKGLSDKDIWNYFMKQSLPKLMASDYIYLLSGWIFSKGARFEAFTAWRLDIPRLKIKIKKFRSKK
jgi:hypothetical protein